MPAQPPASAAPGVARPCRRRGDRPRQLPGPLARSPGHGAGRLYGIRGAGFTSLRRELDWLPPHLAGPPHPQEERLSRAIASGLLHLDDPDRLRATAASPNGQRYIHHASRGSRVLLYR